VCGKVPLLSLQHLGEGEKRTSNNLNVVGPNRLRKAKRCLGKRSTISMLLPGGKGGGSTIFYSAGKRDASGSMAKKQIILFQEEWGSRAPRPHLRGKKGKKGRPRSLISQRKRQQPCLPLLRTYALSKKIFKVG